MCAEALISIPTFHRFSRVRAPVRKTQHLRATVKPQTKAQPRTVRGGVQRSFSERVARSSGLKLPPSPAWGGAIRVRTASRKTHLGRGGCQKLAQQERPQSREHQHGSSSPSQSPDDAGEMGRIPGLPSATGLSFTSRRAAAEWLPLWFQINPSLQAKGLNSDWGTVRGGEGGEEE